MSLHWILVLTVTLLHCLTAHTIPIPIVKDMERSIKELQRVDCTEPDSMFYTPSGTNGCTVNALQCSMLELNTVGSECFETDSELSQRVNRTRDYIEFILKDITQEQANFNHCVCGQKIPKMATYKEFIANLWTLVLKLNSSLESQKMPK